MITVNSRKFDNTIQKSWNCVLLKETVDYWHFVGEFEKQVVHPELGIIRRGTVCHELFWKEKWFSVFRFQEQNGNLQYYYCNINIPPTFENNTLDYIDLDIDVLVYPDLQFAILDEEEFYQNSLILNYPSEIVRKTELALVELKTKIVNKRFPFCLLQNW